MTENTIGIIAVAVFFGILFLMVIGYFIFRHPTRNPPPRNEDDCIDGRSSDNWWIDRQ